MALALPSLQSLIKIQSMTNGGRMASMTIRDIDERLKARLRVQAAHHGRSMEEEARDILRTALSTGRSRKGSLVDSIRARIEPLGGVELEIAPREAVREPVSLDT
jgi:plasmid stability protein